MPAFSRALLRSASFSEVMEMPLSWWSAWMGTEASPAVVRVRVECERCVCSVYEVCTSECGRQYTLLHALLPCPVARLDAGVALLCA